jgi:hypothetical protein
MKYSLQSRSCKRSDVVKLSVTFHKLNIHRICYFFTSEAAEIIIIIIIELYVYNMVSNLYRRKLGFVSPGAVYACSQN